MKISPLDQKALNAIEILMECRNKQSTISFVSLADKIEQPRFALGRILQRVNAWCLRCINKQQLGLLVVDKDGKPTKGMFIPFPDEIDPVTPANYEERRSQLWNENWSGVAPPTLDMLANAHAAARRSMA